MSMQLQEQCWSTLCRDMASEESLLRSHYKF